MMLKKIMIKLYLNIKYNKIKSKIKSCKVSKDIVLGKNVTIGKKSIISRNVSIGDYSYINTQFGETYIDSNVQIGKYCSLAPNICIALGNHNISNVTTHPILYDNYYHFVSENKPKIDDNIKTIIGNDVWIGANSNIRRGIKIGNGAVIAMNSVVTKDVPDYAIVAGIPAKVIKYRFSKSNIDMLLDFKWWDKDEKYIKNNIEKFYDIDDFANQIKGN